MSEQASNAGYAQEADDLFERYERRSAEDVHKRWSHLFPMPPAKILDIGAGTGRDAAWLVSLGHSVLAVEPTDALRLGAQKLHPEPEITWIDDALPKLPEVSARGETFDLILMNAVWMHFDETEREIGMAHLVPLLNPGGRIAMTQRHGPIPDGRRMFDVSGAETIALAARFDLKNLMHERIGSVAAENKARGIEWTKLVFEKA